MTETIDMNHFCLPTTAAMEEGIHYLGPEREERLDLYRPQDVCDGVSRSAILVIHGGGWHCGARNDKREKRTCAILADAGFVCASIDYTLFSENDGQPSWPQCLFDCKAAVQWLRANAARFGIDTARIGCIGFSAGGHLAAMLATTGKRSDMSPPTPFGGVNASIQACASLYGIMNPMRTFTNDRWPHAFGNMTGTGGEMPCDAWLAASPVHHAGPDACPMLLVHGDSDNTVDCLQMDEMKTALDAVGVKCDRLHVPGAGHSFSLDECDGNPLSVDVHHAILDFFDVHLNALKDRGQS